MAVTKTDGTANLRADAHVYTNDAAGDKGSTGSGKDCGGTANLGATTVTKANPGKTVGTFAKDSRPAGVQHFDGGTV